MGARRVDMAKRIARDRFTRSFGQRACRNTELNHRTLIASHIAAIIQQNPAVGLEGIR
jgi:hypothetical protein